MKQKILLTILSLIFLYSCNDDNDKEIEKVIEQEKSNYSKIIEEQDGKISNVINFSKITTTLRFKVTDKQNQPLENTRVLINGSENNTDELGEVSFEDVSVNSNYIVVEVLKEGFEKILKTVTPSANGELITDIILIEEQNSVLLNAEVGGVIEKNNVELLFPSESLIYEDGETYKGEASVKIVYYNPKDTDFLTISPGNLTGVTNDNQEVGLKSEGMLTVHLQDSEGKVLRIANNKTVKVTMPASDSGENEIPFWHLSEKYGIWMEEGKAIKKENKYEFEASHFSTYNLDYKLLDAIDFCVVLKDVDGRLMQNTKVFLDINGLIRSVYSDNNGEACFRNAGKGDYIFKFKDSEKILNVTSNQKYEIIFDVKYTDDDIEDPYSFCLKIVDKNGNPFKSRFITLTVLTSPNNLSFGYVNRLTDEFGEVCFKDLRESEIDYYVAIFDKDVQFQGQIQAIAPVHFFSTTKDVNSYEVVFDVAVLPDGTEAASFTDYYDLKQENRRIYIEKKDRAIAENVRVVDSGAGVFIYLYNQNYTHSPFLYSGNYSLPEFIEIPDSSNLTSGTNYILEFKTNIGFMRYEFTLE